MAEPVVFYWHRSKTKIMDDMIACRRLTFINSSLSLATILIAKSSGKD